MKKIFFAFIAILTGFNAHAIPIVNENVANSGMVTIYPDHQDPHRYYIAPNVVKISLNERGVPNFVYNEFRNSVFGSYRGVIQMTLVPAYTREDLEIAKAEIRQKDHAAEFSGLPFVASKLELSGEIPELIESNNCNHAGGLIGQEQSCTMVLTPRGRRFFINSLEKKTMFTTLQFYYTVDAVRKVADGSLRDQEIQHGIAVRIDGGQLRNFPDLIKSYGW